MKSYSELIALPTYEERLRYLKLEETLVGGPGKRFHVRNRKQWERVRQDVIARDLGFDLGIPGREISGRIIVHHINPVTDDMFCADDPMLYDLENLISASNESHEYIHHGKWPDPPVEPRRPGDTKLW